MSRSTTLTEEVYARLRAEIIAGKIRPNVHLVAADLAERLKASRTPVREALQLLAVDGLVHPGKRGYLVREHTPEEIKQIYEVRAALEGMSARLAAQRATDEEIEQIEQLGAHIHAPADRARSTVVDLNGAFHAAVMDACRNPRLKRLNTVNSEHAFNYQIAAIYSDAEIAAATAGHARILEAIKSRDADAADAAARTHVLEALEATLSKIR